MTEPDPHIVTSALLRDWPLPDVDDEGGKDARGSVVVVGGAADTPGAVLLAGLAALRVGAGRLTLVTVESTAAVLAVAVPESATVGLPADSGVLGASAAGHLPGLLDGADVVVLGPGMRDPDASRAVVAAALHAAPDAAFVVDAMALTCGAVPDRERTARQRLVVTPNTAEAARLLAVDAADCTADAATTRRLARDLDAVVALRSITASPDGACWVDGTGNSGLGTSGSGDVLAGAIAGLLARGAAAEQAAVWGAHLHAAAGERLAARVGRLGYLARELLDELPAVLGELAG